MTLRKKTLVIIGATFIGLVVTNSGHDGGQAFCVDSMGPPYGVCINNPECVDHLFIGVQCEGNAGGCFKHAPGSNPDVIGMKERP